MKTTDFLDLLASKSHTPGGGSAAALVGANAAALVSMVCNLSAGKKSCAEFQDELADTLAKSEHLRTELTTLVEKDADAFNDFMEAMNLPKDTDAEKEKRNQAMEQALKGATLTPLAVMEKSLAVMELAGITARLGYKGAVSDAGCGLILAQAAIRCAHLNVLINLSGLQDAKFRQEAENRANNALNRAKELEKSVDMVCQRLG